MGFQMEETHYKLQFEGDAYDGLEVTVREISVGELTELAGLVSSVSSTSALDKVAAIGRIFTILGESLVSWNVERKGQPVPADESGVRVQNLTFIMTVVQAWMTQMADVTVPLDSGSTDGGTSQELSIPMEPSSPSRGN